MASKHFKPAEVFPPGEYLREELAARRWTQADLAKVIGRPTQVVNEIINGKKAITAQTAKELGLALGTGPELWANLQVYYDLHSTPDADPAIQRRAERVAGLHDGRNVRRCRARIPSAFDDPRTQ